MNLVQELIKGLLPEQEYKKTVAVYGGGFKPPTKGHFLVVKKAIEDNPDIDEFIINIGGKERDGVTPEESIQIWDIYKQYLPISANINIQYSSTPPIKATYDYAKNNPEEKVLFILGAREGNEDDFADIAGRTKSLDNYPNLNLRTIVTQGGVSGTAARNAGKISSEKLRRFLPDELKDEEVEQVYQMISDKLDEGRKKKKDPKKGTGKKPKGSGRRLYTDEDPTDTVKVKFSTRQDIVNTLNKKSFKAKSHARQSQIINLIHQRVRAALARTKDPKKKAKLKSGFEYIKKRKEASKRKTIRLNKKKVNENYSELEQYRKLILKQLIDSKIGKQIRNAVEDKVGKEAVEGVYIIGSVLDSKKFHEESDIDIAVLINVPNMDKGTNEEMSYELSQTYSIPDGSFVDVSIWNRSKPLGKMVKLDEKKGFGKSGYRYRSIYKKDGKFYFMQDNPFSPGIRQEFGPYKTKAAAKRKMQSFPPGTSYRDLTEEELNEKLCKRGKNYIAKRKREGEKHNPFLAGRAVKVCKGQIRGSDGKKKKDFRPKKGKTRSAQGRKPDIVKEIGIDLSNYSGQVLPGDVLRAPKGFPLGGKKLESSKQLKVIKNSREGVNRYKLSLEDSDGKKYTVRNFQMDGEYKGKKLPKWGMIRRAKKNLNEEIDSSKFDFRPYIASLTKYFMDNEMALEPLPKIELIHNDINNGMDVLGKTAYYVPGTNDIVLFTYGRHPKDILRSYAHELVHVHQKNENRLENYGTTNVNQDNHLEKIEREAYETGNILFRSWTDSLDDRILSEGKNKKYKHKYGFDPKLGKDPFGLNAYARELARGLEEQVSEYKVYLDMDGVIADFDNRFKDISGMEPKEFENKYGKEAFWNLIDEENKISFWVGIKEMPGARDLVNYVKNYNFELLTSPSAKKQSYLGKLLWVRNHRDLFGGKPRVNFKRAKEKHQIKANLESTDILIDDREDTIARWNAAGGTGIVFNSASQVINDLKKLGL